MHILARFARRSATALMLAAAPLLSAAPVAASLDPAPASNPMGPEYRAIAASVVETSGDYETAADYLVSAAMDLEDENPDKAHNLRLAGRLYDHAGETAKAHLATLSAGVAAYRSGQPLLAAHAFLDAADLGARLSRPGAAASAADRAGWVLRTSDLDPAARRSVLDRVRYGPNVEIRLEPPIPVSG